MSLQPVRRQALCLLARRVPASRNPRHMPSLATRSSFSTSPSKLSSRRADLHEPLDAITAHRLEVQRRAYYKRRSYYAGVGFVLGMIAIWFTATSIDIENLPPKPTKLDSGARKDDPLVVLGKERKVIVQRIGEEPEEIDDVVKTGASAVPTFPRVLEFGDSNEGVAEGEVEYQLVGLGVRTVSFLGIQVYVVGLYVATDDIAALQRALIRKIDPVASTLVAGEKEKLKEKLMHPQEGEEMWGDVLKSSGARTLIRIVPTRNTDFHHLRDAWVRQVTARAQTPLFKEEYGDDSFGESMRQFKQLFNRGSVPKQKELLMARDGKGKLAVWYDDGKTPQRLGQINDERVSRAVWLNYLGGKTVASEPARASIIEGVMEFVERPVGTVAAQVHV